VYRFKFDAYKSDMEKSRIWCQTCYVQTKNLMSNSLLTKPNFDAKFCMAKPKFDASKLPMDRPKIDALKLLMGRSKIGWN
jgi:hypothetical protein